MFPRKSTGTPFYDPEVAIVKFNSFWTIELEPGYSLFATHPVNRADLPFRLLTGIVDSDRFTDVGILFPAVWTDANFEGVLPRGTPVAQCFPILREALDLQVPAFLRGRSGALPIHREPPALASRRISAAISCAARAFKPQASAAVELSSAKGGLSSLTSALGRCDRKYRAGDASRVDRKPSRRRDRRSSADSGPG